MNDKIEKISVDRIDDPQAPMRTQMDEQKLDELAQSIKMHGLIQPITLRKVGERYEVIAGHRRFTACKRIGIPLISAIVRVLTDSEADGMRMHENLYREDVNPVDEARYIRKMIDIHNVEPEHLSVMTGKSEAYLRARYDLLNFPDYLLQAVEQESISLTAAHWLAKIGDDRVRKEYTRFAIIGGITAKRAEAWHHSWTLGSLPREASAYHELPSAAVPEARKLIMPCILCRHDDDIEEMGMYYSHRDCAEAVRKMNVTEAPPSP